MRDKLADSGTSIFAVMTKMATDYGALNVSQGFPNYNPPATLLALFNKHLHLGANQYAPMPGTTVLRTAIAKKFLECYNFEPDAELEITITAGATQGLFTAFSSFVHPGDEVIYFEPAYDSYLPCITLNGGIPVAIPLQGPGFRIDWELTRSKITGRTTIIVINSPHNPCGSVLTGEDIQELSALVQKHNLLVISDEVYEHIVFDGRRHIALPSVQELRNNTIALYSFGKTYHATGWKVGYVVAPPALSALFRKIHQFTVFAVNTPAQHAYAEFLENRDHYLALPAFYQQKRDLFNSAIAGSRFNLTPAEGAYFQLLDYTALSKLPDAEFATFLVQQYGIAVIPLSPFYHQPVAGSQYIRICFAKTEELLLGAAERLKGVTCQ